MATNIPPHNLGEVCDAIAYLIENPEATIDELADIVKGPDFPTGGIIFRHERVKRQPSDGERAEGERYELQDAIKAAYADGQGRVIVQARTYVEETTKGGRSPDRGHRAALPDEQGGAGGAHRRPGQGTNASTASATCATSRTGTACASSSS